MQKIHFLSFDIEQPEDEGSFEVCGGDMTRVRSVVSSTPIWQYSTLEKRPALQIRLPEYSLDHFLLWYGHHAAAVRRWGNHVCCLRIFLDHGL
jgi:hypothetical protein